MHEGLKKRLIGAAVLASLAVIFVPMLFEEPPSRPPPLPPLPSKPPMTDFASEMLREEVPAVTPLAPKPVAAEPRQEAALPATPPAVKPAPETPRQRTGLHAWVVQVGSFSSRENAEKLVTRLRDAKLPTPDPELVDLSGKRYYRVKVGPVVERSEADGMVGRVSEIAGTKVRVQQYP
jgi:DedD protein